MHHTIAPNLKRLTAELLPEHLLASISVLGETSDTLVELVESHGVVEELPSESSLVVDERDLLHLVGRGGRSVELLGDLGAERLAQVVWQDNTTYLEFLSSSRSLGAMVR